VEQRVDQGKWQGRVGEGKHNLYNMKPAVAVERNEKSVGIIVGVEYERRKE
jgi:hypothetical protein